MSQSQIQNSMTQLEAMKIVLDSAQSRVAFWGIRVVEHVILGSVSLDNIAENILSAGRQCFDEDGLTPAERIAGIEIVRRLIHFYQTTDHQRDESNCFTRLLICIREFTFFRDTTRLNIETIASTYFRAYSELSFLRLYSSSTGNCAWSSSSRIDDKILASEEAIRTLI